MRGNSHVRFGGRPGETNQPQGRHRTPGRPLLRSCRSRPAPLEQSSSRLRGAGAQHRDGCASRFLRDRDRSGRRGAFGWAHQDRAGNAGAVRPELGRQRRGRARGDGQRTAIARIIEAHVRHVVLANPKTVRETSSSRSPRRWSRSPSRWSPALRLLVVVKAFKCAEAEQGDQARQERRAAATPARAAHLGIDRAGRSRGRASRGDDRLHARRRAAARERRRMGALIVARMVARQRDGQTKPDRRVARAIRRRVVADATALRRPQGCRRMPAAAGASAPRPSLDCMR
jgi:hypothetical protein